MGWSNQQTDELVIPPGAGPGEYRTIYGGTPPAELEADGLLSVSRRIYTNDLDTYWYEGIKPNGSQRLIVRGWVINGVVNETQADVYSTGLGTTQLQFDTGVWIGSQSNEGRLVLANPEVTVWYSVDPNFQVGALGIGDRDLISSTAGSGAIGAEAVVLTGRTIDWVQNRVYRVTVAAHVIGSLAANLVFFRIRKTNLAGTVLADNMNFDITNTHGRWCQFEVHIAGPDGFSPNYSGNIVLTAQASAGTISITGANTTRRYMAVTDVGDVAPSTGYSTPIRIN